MTKLEIAEKEKANGGVVYLYAEGTFYKAYQQSAFLLSAFVRPLKVSVRPLKGMKGPLLSVGFPMMALEKWTSGADIQILSDKSLEVHYPFPLDLSGYDAWRSTYLDTSANKRAAILHPRLSDEYYPVYGLAFRMTREVTEYCSRLKRNYRYSLGEDLRSSMMQATIAITFASKQDQLLTRATEAIEHVEKAELSLRLLNVMGELSDERYTPLIDMTNDIRKQLEKWVRSAQSSQKTAGVSAP